MYVVNNYHVVLHTLFYYIIITKVLKIIHLRKSIHSIDIALLNIVLWILSTEITKFILKPKCADWKTLKIIFFKVLMYMFLLVYIIYWFNKIVS